MRVASLAGVSADVVAKEAERRRKRIVSQAVRASEREQTRPERQTQPEAKELRYDDPASAAAEQGVIRLLYLEPELVKSPLLPESGEFSSPALAHIYGEIASRLRRGDAVTTATLGSALTQQEMSLLVDILQKPETLSRAESALSDYTHRIRERRELREQGTDLRALAQKLREKRGYEG